jgi:hypothetical protein
MAVGRTQARSVGVDSVYVNLFGNPVKVINEDGAVLFDKASFVRAVGWGRSKRIFQAMDEEFAFLGREGVDQLVAEGKDYILNQLVLANKDAPQELRDYAMAWSEAYELMAGQQ